MSDGPLTPEGLRVSASLCSTCIFRPGNLMQLKPRRVRGMVDEALRNDAFIACHKTLDGERAVCRGFYNLHKTDTLGCRLGSLVGIIEVNPDEGEAP